MISKIIGNELFDIYGDLLTERQCEILVLYYEEDLSYTEVSEELSISRAAVMDSVHRATKLLEHYEEVIGYLRKREKLDRWIQKNKDLDGIEELEEIF